MARRRKMQIDPSGVAAGDADEGLFGEELIAETKEADDVPAGPQPARLSEDLLGDTKVVERALEIALDAENAFRDQEERTNDILAYWDMYHCKLGPKQVYAGNSQLFAPLIHDAVNARTTRFVNQMFPRSERYVDVTTSDGTVPHGVAAILEHYIRKAGLRSRVMPALMRSGDIEGQYTLYVDWNRVERWVTTRARNEFDLENPDEEPEDDDLVTENIVDEWPGAEVISDPDFAVWPATSDTIEEAQAAGGGWAILRRWSKTKIERMIAAGEIDKEAGELMASALTEDGEDKNKDVARNQTDAAGIRRDARGAYYLVHEIWAILPLEEGDRLCRIIYAGEQNIVSIRRNPYWCDLNPVISTPVEKVAGSFKGRPKIAPVADYQIAANDALNEGMDSAAYALMPIIMTDPVKNPRIGSMILSLAAIWETSPNDTQFAKFPELWKDAFEIVNAAKQQIFSTLSVNPAMITQGNPYRKPTQAEVAAEQQVDVLTTADAVTIVENGILTPWVRRAVSYDSQYRRTAITVKQYGEMGLRANMEQISPISDDNHWQFRWFGVEAARNAQQIQQQIAAINVIRTIPPQLYQGYRLDLAPAIVQMIESAFGPYLAPLVFKDMRSSLSQDPGKESEILLSGMELPVHPMDDHEQHMAVHVKALQAAGPGGDENGALRVHLLLHQEAIQRQQMAQMAAIGGMPGQPQGQPGPEQGTPGQPRPGAQPGQPRPGQGPAGMIHRDQMQDPAVMPRTVGSKLM